MKRFCPVCVDLTEHKIQSDGSYYCLVCKFNLKVDYKEKK